MNKFKILLTIGLFSALTFSCSDSWLEEKPYSSYTPELVGDSLGVEASITGLHYTYGTIWTWADQQGWLSVWQVGTDIATAGNPQGVEKPFYQYNNLTSESKAAEFIWEQCYNLIGNANTLIKSVETNSIKGVSQNGLNVAEAEARFFRAYSYNILVTVFGGVPKITEPQNFVRTDYTRASADDINNLIIEDLLVVSEKSPDVDKTRFPNRVNKYMGKQLIGEVYIRVGKPELAEPQLKDIINSGKFSLIKSRYGIHKDLPGDYYSDMFIYGNQRRKQGNTEALWVFEVENPNIVVGGVSGAPQFRRAWVPSYYEMKGMVLADSLGGRGNGRIRLSSWVYNKLYDKADIRNSQYNLRRKLYYNDPSSPLYKREVVALVPSDTIYRIPPYSTKWGCFDPTDTFGWSSIKDWINMRLGETYLLLAEAQLNQGKTAEAAANINVLRERAFANYPTQGKVSAGDINLDFILDERARELIGEENRRMTLMRTKTLVERTGRLNQDAKGSQYEITGLTNTNLLLPIPLREIQLNKDAVLEQNPGYK